MQAAQRPLPLRVLYTLNASPQYLLARHRHRVEVVPILEESNKSVPLDSERTRRMIAKQRYAKVSLKTCLGAVCNASPELVCDRSRDYSVYVVDPLESPPSDDNTIRTPSQSVTDVPSETTYRSRSEGISIGMGLMSWCLSENSVPSTKSEDDGDDGYVVGKIVRDRGADALEIIMSLRETATQTQRQHALSLSSWGFPAQLTVTDTSNVSSPSAPISSSIRTSPGPLMVSIPSQPPSERENLGSEGPEGRSDPQASSAPGPTMHSGGQVDGPARTKPKKIGRPQGSKTHPEKRARQLAIQMHKEKLERLVNIVKMQNGEEYDKTLIIASECESKVTDDIIAREQRLLEELQSRPLIVDGPRYTTEPLPRRTTSPATHIPLVETTAPKRKKRTAASSNAIASGSSIGKNPGPSSVQLTQAATKKEHEAGLLLSLLSSVLGKVDEPAAMDATVISGPGRGNEKGKDKETSPLVNDALAQALQKLLPYLPNHATGHNAPPTNAPPTTSTKVGTSCNPHSAVDTKTRPEPKLSTQHPQTAYPQLFKTAEESFYSNSERGPNWHSDNHWVTRGSVTSKGDVPKVREDAHPVPGGGWARGKNIVPRATASSQLETTSSDENRLDNGAVTRPTALTAIATPDKENMPPAKSKRGLKRSFSSSVGTKENATSIDALPSKNSSKKRKPEDVARSTKPKATSRTMVGSAETNRGNHVMFPASSPVRSRTFTSPPRSLPVVAVSEPDSLLPRFVGQPLVAPSISLDSLTKPSRGPPKSDRLSEGLLGPLITHSTSPNSPTEPPRTPPRRDRPLDDAAGESLFTPCAPMSDPRLVNALPWSESLSSSPSQNSASTPRRTDGLHERPSSIDGEVECRQSATRAFRPVGTGWDLPPSSPPPPTSPILPGNNLAAEENQMDWDSATQLQSELDVEMEKAGTDGRFEDRGTTINSAGSSTPAVGIRILDDGSSDQLSAFETTSDFDASSDDVLDLGGLEQDDGRLHAGGDVIGLDIDELWSSLGPVIAHAQLDPGLHAEPEFGFYGLADDQSLVEPEEHGAVDPIKLADDLKALFGGCVV